jgi:hypothetical protein
MSSDEQWYETTLYTTGWTTLSYQVASFDNQLLDPFGVHVRNPPIMAGYVLSLSLYVAASTHSKVSSIREA